MQLSNSIPIVVLAPWPYHEVDFARSGIDFPALGLYRWSVAEAN